MKESQSMDKYKKYDYFNKYNQRTILEQNKTNKKSTQKRHNAPKLNHMHQHIKIQDNSRDKSSKKSYSLPKQQTGIQRKLYQPNFAHSTAPDSPRQIFNKIPDLGYGLSAQISSQNQILRGQVVQYQKIVNKLQTELDTYRKQVVYLRERIQADSSIYQKKINELSNQLEHFQKRYRILDDQLRQRVILQQNTEKQSQIIAQNLHIKFLHKIDRILPQQRQKQILELLHYREYLAVQNIFEIKIRQIQKQNHTYHDFIKTLNQMKTKIQQKASKQNTENDLKSLWKWLKKIGAIYHHLQCVKPIFIEKIHQKKRKNGNTCQRSLSITQIKMEELIDEILLTYSF